MSVSSQIDRISGNVAAAYSAAESKGATMPTEQNSENLPSTIESIVPASSIDLSPYYEKTGGEIRGRVTIVNDGEYFGLTKVRKVNNANYYNDFAVGSDTSRGASSSIRLTDANGNTKGRIDIWENGTITYTPNGSGYYVLYGEHNLDLLSSALGAPKIAKGAIGEKTNTVQTITFDFTVAGVMFNTSYGTQSPTRWVTAGNNHTASGIGKFVCTSSSISFTPYSSTYVPIPYVVFGQ